MRWWRIGKIACQTHCRCCRNSVVHSGFHFSSTCCRNESDGCEFWKSTLVVFQINPAMKCKRHTFNNGLRICFCRTTTNRGQRGGHRCEPRCCTCCRCRNVAQRIRCEVFYFANANQKCGLCRTRARKSKCLTCGTIKAKRR